MKVEMLKKLISSIVIFIFLAAPAIAGMSVKEMQDQITRLEGRRQLILVRAQAQIDLLNQDIRALKEQIKKQQAEKKKPAKKPAKDGR